MDEDINIDDEWISEFNDEERRYGQFYKEPNTFISLQFIYINSKKEIEHVTQQGNHQLDKENILSSTTLNKLISERNHINGSSYRLYKLLLNNITLEPDDIISNELLKNPVQLREITEIMDITLDETINYFKSLNTLFFVFVRAIKCIFSQ
jgi:deoxyadenosine/deoxycytidine kinase